MPTPNALIVDTIIDESATGIVNFEGEHTASEIAQAVAAAVGLSLQWATDDYTLHDGFDASGDSAEQVIRDLIKPMSLERHTGASVFEPFSTDFYMAGETAVVKKRQGLAPSAEYTLTVDNIGASKITITKTRLPIWGSVTLVGRASSNAVQQTPPGSASGSGTGGTGTVPDPTTPAGQQAGGLGHDLIGTDVQLDQTYETRNAKDGSITQTIINRVVLMPDNLPRQIRTTKYLSDKNGAGLKLQSTKLETWDYLHFGYDNKGPRAHAKVLQKFVEITSRVGERAPIPAVAPTPATPTMPAIPGRPAIPGSAGSLEVTSADWTAYAYDTRFFVRMEGTLKFKLGATGLAKSPAPLVTGLLLTTTPNVSKTWHVTQNDDVGLGYTSVTRDEYTFVVTQGSTAITAGIDATGQWEHTGNFHNITGGKAPGGPQPGTHEKVTSLPAATGSGFPGGFEVQPTNTSNTGGYTINDNTTGRGVQRETLQAVISTGDEAQAYSYSNPNLTMTDLQRIMSQMRASSGLYQYQVEVKGPDAAFLRRGQYVQIVGAQAPTGESIALAPMIITRFERKFNEARAESSMTMVGRFWRSTDTMIDSGAGANP